MEILQKDKSIAPFVKEIIFLQDHTNKIHHLPFYADGYPGIMYSETNLPIKLLPINKSLPNFFLYGQTIEPIQLQVNGAFKIVVFQLYPFATRLLLDINPREINDACYDLMQVKNINTSSVISKLETSDTLTQTQIISEYVLDLVKNASDNPDNLIKLAITTILKTKGLIPINQLRARLHITERTFERRFKKEIGVTPKQFAKIIQFSFSLDQIQDSDYTKLTNVAYENGFADQSHFIRTFKKYTGTTPKEILSKMG